VNNKIPINVALVGFGFSGSTFHAPFLSALNDYNLCCVVSSNPEKVQASLASVHVESDFTKVLKDPALDLIVIATPNTTHYELAKAALESGKHVVVDKPLTIHSREAEDLIQIAKRRSRILTTYHNRRWDGDSYEEESVWEDEDFKKSLIKSDIFGAFVENKLIGVAGFFQLTLQKLKHRGTLFGLYVRKENRGHSVADQLLETVIKHARQQVIQLHCTVTTDNKAAINLYQRYGFQIYGTEPQFLRASVGLFNS
jgi:ribosomal protein S18 acetylase RimI-like enzyme